MAKAIKLTAKQWRVVQSQCIYCGHWNAIEGCQYEEASSRYPVEDCGEVKEGEG